MRFGAVVFLLFLVLPGVVRAEVSPRTGFVDGPVWFSQELLKLDTSVKIYTAIFNGESSKITLKVDFVDNTTALSTKEIIVSPNETKTVSTDWKVSSGSHEIFAIISSAKVDGEQVILERLTTDSVKFSVTKDTPGNVVKDALAAKFSSLFEGEGDFTQKADTWFKTNFTKSEEFREKTLKKIQASKSEVESRREKEKDVKGSSKVISFLHLYFLIFAGFVFSVSVVFYICAVLLIYLALRTLWRILRRIFRRQHEE